MPLPALPVGVLEGMGALDLVCLDDLQAVAGQPEWEIALFRLYEELRNSGGNLVVASNGPPAESVFGLRGSRLAPEVGHDVSRAAAR